MMLNPNSIEDLCQMLKTANASGTRVEAWDLARVSGLVEYTPEDMVATVQAGMSLSRFQEHLRTHGQWLPVDPPQPEKITIGDLLSENWSGPRRHGYGPIRDYLIGIKVAMADGTVIKAGGKVVKNVAGYDLCKLFIGSKGTLGVIVEATFKLRPLPESELVLQKNFDSIEELQKAADAILNSAAEPAIFDAHNLNGKFMLVIAFAGAREDVEFQTKIVRDLGLNENGSLQYNDVFWANAADIQKISVLPAETGSTLKKMGPAQFVARFGNGIVYYRGASVQQKTEMPFQLMRRLKQAYDPKGILPEYRV